MDQSRRGTLPPVSGGAADTALVSARLGGVGRGGVGGVGIGGVGGIGGGVCGRAPHAADRDRPGDDAAARPGESRASREYRREFWRERPPSTVAMVPPYSVGSWLEWKCAPSDAVSTCTKTCHVDGGSVGATWRVVSTWPLRAPRGDGDKRLRARSRGGLTFLAVRESSIAHAAATPHRSTGGRFTTCIASARCAHSRTQVRVRDAVCAAWGRARALAAAGLRVVRPKGAEELARGGERQPGGANRAHVDDNSDPLRPAHAPHREAVLVEDVEELIGEDLGTLARVAIGSDEHRRRATAVEAAQHHAPRRRAQLLSQRLRRPPPLSPSHVGCDRLEGSERAERRLHGLQEAKQLVVVVSARKDELGVEEQHAQLVHRRRLGASRPATALRRDVARGPLGWRWVSAGAACASPRSLAQQAHHVRQQREHRRQQPWLGGEPAGRSCDGFHGAPADAASTWHDGLRGTYCRFLCARRAARATWKTDRLKIFGWWPPSLRPCRTVRPAWRTRPVRRAACS